MHASWTSARPLVDLALRRALAPAVVIGYAALGAWLASRDWTPATALLGAAGDAAKVQIAHGLVRQGIWGGACIALLPVLVLRSGRIVRAWRRGEVDWLASRAATRTSVLTWTWLGTFAASVIVVLAIAVVVEARVGSGAPSFRYAGELGDGGSGWVEGRRALEWTCADPGARAPAGSRLRIELVLATGSTPGAEIVFDVRRIARAASGERADTDSRRRTVERIGTRGAIEIELPPAEGDLAFSLACGHDNERACLVTTRGALWTPVASDRAASVGLFARACAALAAWTALAIGLGAWMHAASAAFFLFALMLPAWMAIAPPSAIPGADLLSALAIAGEGRVPLALDLRVLATSAVAVVLGLALARWSVASWRRVS
jgi:hypothetical protein